MKDVLSNNKKYTKEELREWSDKLGEVLNIIFLSKKDFFNENSSDYKNVVNSKSFSNNSK
jgi:hypothetical protein